MISGQVFKLDEQGVQETALFYKTKLAKLNDLVGGEFAIASGRTSNAITEREVMCSRIVNGKPSIGRPRRFPRTVVARLLGETNDPVFSLPPLPTKVTTSPKKAEVLNVHSDDVDGTESTSTEATPTEENEDDSRATREARAAELVASW